MDFSTMLRPGRKEWQASRGRCKAIRNDSAVKPTATSCHVENNDIIDFIATIETGTTVTSISREWFSRQVLWMLSWGQNFGLAGDCFDRLGHLYSEERILSAFFWWLVGSVTTQNMDTTRITLKHNMEGPALWQNKHNSGVMLCRSDFSCFE